ncbi:hypothetical protein O3M35_011031 [Rhynocoris fuscipes]|uniref:Reverse transcriptase domain-containing protein n=1 Tax=Rhynocoris fuscipes TaxID=488301 RepID=A0AAW1CWQ4_9HEMI
MKNCLNENNTFLLLSRLESNNDLVPHDRLLQKLQLLGISGDSLNFFKQYMAGRTQCVQYNGVVSSLKPIRRGVIQGSVLGPLMFLIYFNDFAQELPDKCIQFADVTTLISKHKHLKKVEEQAENDLEIAKKWLSVNIMILNEDKTAKLKFTLHSDYKSENINFLGVTLDTKLTWNLHTERIIKSTMDKWSLIAGKTDNKRDSGWKKRKKMMMMRKRKCRMEGKLCVSIRMGMSGILLKFFYTLGRSSSAAIFFFFFFILRKTTFT